MTLYVFFVLSLLYFITLCCTCCVIKIPRHVTVEHVDAERVWAENDVMQQTAKFRQHIYMYAHETESTTANTTCIYRQKADFVEDPAAKKAESTAT